MELLTRAAIQNADDRAHLDLTIPAWGGTVRLRVLSGAEYEEFAQLCRQRAAAGDGFDIRGIRVRLIALCIVDEAGNRVFHDEDGVAELNTKSTATLEILWDECRKLNRMNDEDVEEMAGE